jgi:hypothetical protein
MALAGGLVCSGSLAACSGKSGGSQAPDGGGGPPDARAGMDARTDLLGADGRNGCPNTLLLCNRYCLNTGEQIGNCAALIVGPFPTSLAVTSTHT